jgi:hypothetical protein
MGMCRFCRLQCAQGVLCRGMSDTDFYGYVLFIKGVMVYNYVKLLYGC